MELATKLGGGVYRDVKIRDFFYTVKLSCSPVEQRANCERKTGAKELDSSLRGTQRQRYRYHSGTWRRRRGRRENEKQEKSAHAPV